MALGLAVSICLLFGWSDHHVQSEISWQLLNFMILSWFCQETSGSQMMKPTDHHKVDICGSDMIGLPWKLLQIVKFEWLCWSSDISSSTTRSKIFDLFEGFWPGGAVPRGCILLILAFTSPTGWHFNLKVKRLNNNGISLQRNLIQKYMFPRGWMVKVFIP